MHKGLDFNKLNLLFRNLLGEEKASLYPYQEKVAGHLLGSNKNIILRAPTGAGKTWAALLPYLYARLNEIPFVDRVLYALPLRSLATQLYNSTIEGWRRVAQLLDNSNENRCQGDISITIQTGEQQDDPFSQGNIVFMTIDQLLSGYLLSPVSLPRRLGNINAGAIIGSLVVFDEFHLLDPRRSMGTALEMLDRLSGVCRYILMTATLSDEAVSWLSKRLGNGVVVDLDQEEIDAIEKKKEQPTSRVWSYREQPMDARDIFERHKSSPGRTLVLANTVRRAQQIYAQLKELIEQSKAKTELVLLHSRFFPRDRGSKEALVEQMLGKRAQRRETDFILVSTQVVEAGMDFSADVLHSELAPINSLIQRAGRCARYGGEGLVYIYPVESEYPYTMAIKETEGYLASGGERVYDYEAEREAVNGILGALEKEALMQYENLLPRRSRVNLAMDGMLPGARDELIRDINSVNVLLTSSPEAVRFDRSGELPEMLSVPLESLRGFIYKAANAPGDQWVAKMPVADDSGNAESRVLRFQWQELDPKMLPMSWLVALNPAFTHYSAEMGLILGEAGPDVPVSYRQKKSYVRYSLQRETYAEHIRRVVQQYMLNKKKNECAVAMLAEKLPIKIDEIEKAVLLAILLHDLGKLSVDWQSAAGEWQKYKAPGYDLKEPLAHTDYNPEEDWEKQRSFPRRPNHAVEGAYAACNYLYRLFDGKAAVAACICTAIARHHAGHAAKLDYFRLIHVAAEVINYLLREVGLPPADDLLDNPDPLTCGAQGEFAEVLLSAARIEDEIWLPLYFFIVRQLRLADQAGSAEGGKQ